MPEYTTFDRRGDADMRRQAEIFSQQCERGECVEGRSYQFDRSRQCFCECHDRASHEPRQRESPRVIVAAEALLGQRLGRTPRQIVEQLERRYGLQPETARPLTDEEYQRFQDPFIAKPDDYGARLDARNRQQLREVLAKRDAAKARQEQAKQAEAKLDYRVVCYGS